MKRNLVAKQRMGVPARRRRPDPGHRRAASQRVKPASPEVAAALAVALDALHRQREAFTHLGHEIRSALNGIVGTLELLRCGACPGEAAEFLDNMAISADMLMALVDNIVDLAKLEAGKLDIAVEAFSPARVVSETLKAETGRLLAKGLAAGIDLAPTVPTWVQGDAFRLRQVLLNLLGNAVKFTQQGAILLAVALEEETDTRCTLRFSVRDTGSGLRPEVLEKLFQPFVQGDAMVAGRHGGSGLGLAICRQLVERMGGRIWAESHVGAGSVFHVLLPFAKVSVHEYDI